MLYSFGKPAVITKRQARINLHQACSYVLPNSDFSYGATAPFWPGPPHYLGFRIKVSHTTFSMTPPDKRLAQIRHMYLTTHDAQKRHTRTRQYSNPQSQQGSGLRPTLLTARPPGSGKSWYWTAWVGQCSLLKALRYVLWVTGFRGMNLFC